MILRILGEVSEWFKELVLKTSDTATYRGFESHPLRHIQKGKKCQLYINYTIGCFFFYVQNSSCSQMQLENLTTDENRRISERFKSSD